jgi:predicted trehalose synthase
MGDDPAAEGPFLDAVAAWELDKAVYEVNYELNNRPDWLELPLSTLLGQ